MNKRINQMMGKAVVGTTLAAMAAIGAGQVASASNLMGTCATTGTFTEGGTCTVLAGEMINFEIKGGDGGDGGYGGPGGDGGNSSVTESVGGSGGAGGQPGAGGPGARVFGNYTNSTDATVTLTFLIGVNGADGVDGVPGADGNDGVLFSDGGAGQDGGNGGYAEGGTYSLIRAGDQPVVLVYGGAGGSGGGGGGGGTGGAGGTTANGADGVQGASADAGLPGFFLPSPLPDSWSNDTELGTPGVVFSGSGVPEATTTTVAATSTTVAAPSTTVAAPSTTVAAPQLPATGSDAGSTAWVTLLVLASGAALVVLARRRVVS